jgi:hypothetical protein
MQKTKAKRRSHWLVHSLLFAFLWAISEVIMGRISNAFTETPFFLNLTYDQMAIVLVLWVDIVGGMIQVQLVERMLKKSMRGWLVITLIGNLITLILAHQINNNPTLPTTTTNILVQLVYFVPVLALQTAWLARRVYKPWLWGSSILVLSMGFNRLYETTPRLMHSPAATVLGLLSSMLAAGIMYFLWSHPRDTEKAKVDFATAENVDEDRIERLEERDSNNPLWEVGDHPTLQSEA